MSIPCALHPAVDVLYTGLNYALTLGRLTWSLQKFSVGSLTVFRADKSTLSPGRSFAGGSIDTALWSSSHGQRAVDCQVLKFKDPCPILIKRLPWYENLTSEVGKRIQALSLIIHWGPWWTRARQIRFAPFLLPSEIGRARMPPRPELFMSKQTKLRVLAIAYYFWL